MLGKTTINAGKRNKLGMINIRLNWPTPNTPSIIINIIILLADRLIEFLLAGGSLIDFLCAPPLTRHLLAGAASRLGAWPRTCPNMSPRLEKINMTAAAAALPLPLSQCRRGVSPVGRCVNLFTYLFTDLWSY